MAVIAPLNLPRAARGEMGVSANAVGALLDSLDGIECHSLMIVRKGHVIAEGWWAPYSAERPHLLYSLTKSFTAIAVGIAIDRGLLSLSDRIVDVLPESVPGDASAQARRLTVHHLLSMTVGYATDSLGDAWERSPNDLVHGFLGLEFTHPEGTQHVYDNSTTFILARMLERTSGLELDDFLNVHLFVPMGIEDVEWDRVASGKVFGFHGLHLCAEAVAAFGELLLRRGMWNGRQLVSRDWIERATSKHIDSRHYGEGTSDADFSAGYGYQIWMARHGFHGNGAFGQHCIVVPEHELVVVLNCAQTTLDQAQEVLDAVWDVLLPGVDQVGNADDDVALRARLGELALPVVGGEAGTHATVSARIDGSVENSALDDGEVVVLTAVDGGWMLRLSTDLEVPVGWRSWQEGSPFGRPVSANGGWQGEAFIVDLYVISSPHRVRLTLEVETGVATLVWMTAPLTSHDVRLHLQTPLITRPDVA